MTKTLLSWDAAKKRDTLDKPALRTVMCLLMGGWLLGTILIALVAAENFWIIDRLLATSLSEPFQRGVAALPVGEARALMRYLASEQNRFFFTWWGWTEGILGIALVLMAARMKSGRLLAGLVSMLALVIICQLYLTPQIVEIGRSLDFVPREPPPPQLRRFGILHAAYTVVDLVKLGLGGWVTWALIRQARAAAPGGASATRQP